MKKRTLTYPRFAAWPRSPPAARASSPPRPARRPRVVWNFPHISAPTYYHT